MVLVCLVLILLVSVGSKTVISRDYFQPLIYELEKSLPAQPQPTSVESCVVLLPVTALGLANRLRIIAGFYAIATQEKCKLVVMWKQSEECAIDFDEIFIRPPASQHLEVLSFDDTYTLPIFESATRLLVADYIADRDPSSSNPNPVFLQELHPTRFLVELPRGPEGTHASSHSSTSHHPRQSLFLVYTRGSHAPATLPCTDYLRLKRDFYQLELGVGGEVRTLKRIKLLVLSRHSYNRLV